MASSSGNAEDVQSTRPQNETQLRKGTTRHGPQAHGRATGCARGAVGDAPGDLSGDVPWTCQGPVMG
eukprot:4483679-Pyramimonas_sp.AAC.1